MQNREFFTTSDATFTRSKDTDPSRSRTHGQSTPVSFEPTMRRRIQSLRSDSSLSAEFKSPPRRHTQTNIVVFVMSGAATATATATVPSSAVPSTFGTYYATKIGLLREVRRLSRATADLGALPLRSLSLTLSLLSSLSLPTLSLSTLSTLPRSFKRSNALHEPQLCSTLQPPTPPLPRRFKNDNRIWNV